jgi:hypothetical protein
LKHFPFVHSINLDLCPDIEDKDVVSIITSLGRNLRSISLAGCVKVLRAPSYLTPYPTLRSLVIAFDGLKANASLGSGTQVSEQAVEKLVTECPNLENVSLSGCDRITDASLECLSSLTKLQQLVRPPPGFVSFRFLSFSFHVQVSPSTFLLLLLLLLLLWVGRTSRGVAS